MKRVFRTIGAFIVATLPPLPLFLIHAKIGALALFIMWLFAALSTLPNKNDE